jgi:hypothetical protein
VADFFLSLRLHHAGLLCKFLEAISTGGETKEGGETLEMSVWLGML